MSLAYNLAIEAYRQDEVPIGAVIVKNQEVIASAYNQVETLRDATAHAEMLAITQATQKLGDWRLEGCCLYVTKEPCPMCAGAILLSRITKVVYASPDPKMGGNGGALAIHDLPESFHRYAVLHGPLQEECTQMIKEFFRQRRK
jgi:tRNA(adenine34) deaminase